ncbi:VCBS repeat-containing protein [Mariniblastus sp.]|nr:VCBS repeat-containing protein [Mariniblastus sp.]
MNTEHHAGNGSHSENAPKKKSLILSIFKWIAGLLLLMVVGMALFVILRFRNDARIPYTVSTDGITIPTFDEIVLPFSQNYVKADQIQATGGCVFNLDDGPEELFLAGGQDQNDVIYRFVDGAFKDITSEIGYMRDDQAEATMSATSLDVDHDGDDDLIVTRKDSIWLYTNDDGKLSGKKLDAPLTDETTPLSIAVADLNRDGHFDMYVCGYLKKNLIEGYNIFNKEGYGGMSALLINNGDNTFANKTEEAGLSYKHNTFQAVFFDADQDGDEDLIVAHDTGQVRTWRNNGDMKFENVKNPNSDVYGYPMGVGVGDYDNDGLVDFFFSNTGTTAPPFMARGDLRDDQIYHPEWIMFHNDGDFKFTDTATQTKVADYEFSWGCIFEDFNLDGRTDLVVSENYVDLPPHKVEFLRLPGRFLVQNTDGEFAAVGAEAGVINKGFGLSPVTADFNQDGAPDLVHINLAGHSKVFLSKNTQNGFVKVKLPNAVESVSAMVKAELADGRTIYEPFVKGEGLCSDSSPIVTIGTGGAEVTSIEVKFLAGKPKSFDAVELGSTLVCEYEAEDN